MFNIKINFEATQSFTYAEMLDIKISVYTNEEEFKLEKTIPLSIARSQIDQNFDYICDIFTREFEEHIKRKELPLIRQIKKQIYENKKPML